MTKAAALPSSPVRASRRLKSLTLPVLALIGLSGTVSANEPAKPAAAAAAKPAAKPAPAAALSKPAAPAAQPPQKCEVEFTGQVVSPVVGKLPAGLSFWVYAAEGDCLAKDVRILGSMRASDQGSFAIEVFSKWGADLTLCAAVAKTPESATTMYGKLARKFHAEAQGEIIFEKLQIPLKPGPERTFPKVNNS